MAHTHNPMPEELPRDWADAAWDEWVAASGTTANTRTWDFYREDLAWVYSRVIAPLESKVAQLTERVKQLEQAGSGGVSEARVKQIIAASKVTPPS